MALLCVTQAFVVKTVLRGDDEKVKKKKIHAPLRPRLAQNFRLVIFKLICGLLWHCPDQCHLTLLFISLHWFRWCIGVVSQQVITRFNVVIVLWRHLALLSHTELCLCLMVVSFRSPRRHGVSNHRLLDGFCSSLIMLKVKKHQTSAFWAFMWAIYRFTMHFPRKRASDGDKALRGLIIHSNIFEAVLLFILALVAVQITKSSSPNQ